MAGRRPDYVLTAMVPNGGRGKTRWTRIGAAWIKEGRNGKYLSISLDALPLGRQLTLHPYDEDRERRPSDDAFAEGAAEDGGNDVPF